MLYLLLLVPMALLVVIIYILTNRLKDFNLLKKNYVTITILQYMMEILGKKISSEQKLEEINNILMSNYDAMYSTIVSFSGADVEIKATNVEEYYHEIYYYLAEDETFRKNVENNISKYLATDQSDDTLRYPSANERNIKAAMFLPLYIQEEFIGYWIMEDTRENSFYEVEKVHVSIVKNNLALILENNNHQANIEKMAVTDRLTSLYNRYYLYSKGKSAINSYPISTIVIFDIDHFKKVNDTYGHDAGDKVLIETVKITSAFLSKDEIFVRYGGEEFIILFPGKEVSECYNKVERIRQSLAERKIPIDDVKAINVTASYGICSTNKSIGLDNSIKQADEALYNAKQTGRNKVIIA